MGVDAPFLQFGEDDAGDEVVQAAFAFNLCFFLAIKGCGGVFVLDPEQFWIIGLINAFGLSFVEQCSFFHGCLLYIPKRSKIKSTCLRW